MTDSLRGQVAIVTGASGGIGGAIARALISARVKVYAPEHALLDVTNATAVKEYVRFVMGQEERLDILVNCAAAAPAVEASETLDLYNFHRVIETDLVGTFLMCREAGREMIARGYGRVVNLSSVHARLTYPHRAAYATAKAAVIGLTQALAVEWAGRGVTVNAIAPATVESPRSDGFFERDPEALAAILARSPSSHLATLADVANAALWLCQPASGFINGITLPVDGAWSVSGWYHSFTGNE